MSTIVRPPATDRQPGTGSGGGVFDLPPGTGGSGGSGVSPHAQGRYYTGMMVGLAGILMLFTGFTSAFLVRRGLGDDWQSIPLPTLVWVNTLILLLSSGCLEMARKRVHEIVSLRKWWLAATLLGVAFLIGQGVVWKQLWNAGLFLSTNPSSSFFYVLTATHGIHLLGGVIALLVLSGKIWKGLLNRMHVDVMALYWHFMDGLWVFLLLLFVVGR